MARKALDLAGRTKIIIYCRKIQLTKAISSRLGCSAYFADIADKEEKNEIIQS